MIGTDPNLDLPSLDDALSSIVSKLVTAVSTLADSIKSKATPAALDINTSLDLNGNALTEVTSVQFAAGNIPTKAGSIYYYQGDWYLVDSVGTIQATDNGQLNASGFGAIVGDYGGTNPARVSFDDASGQYRFTQDSGVWASLVAKNLILEGVAGTVNVGVDDALSGDRVLNVKSLPATGISLLAYDATNNALVDGAAATISNKLVSSTSVAADKFYHSGKVTLSLPGGLWRDPSVSHVEHADRWQITSSTNALSMSLVMPVGAHITDFKVHTKKVSSASDTITVVLWKTISTTPAATSLSSVSNSADAPGVVALEKTGLDIAVSAGEQFYLVYTPGGEAGNDLYHVEIQYTLPSP